MQFSDTTNLTGIVEDIDFICGTDSTSYPLKDKARNVNRHYYKAIIDMLRASKIFPHDDPALATDNVVEMTMTAETSTVALNTNAAIAAAYRYLAWEVQDSNGDWHRLRWINKYDLQSTISDFQETSGLPKYYTLDGNYIWLYPKPAAADTTLTNGLRAHVQREVDLFGYGDTSPEPGIPEPFRRVLSLGASYDWLVINDTSAKADRILQQYEQLRAELRTFAAMRNADVPPGFTPAHRLSDYL